MHVGLLDGTVLFGSDVTCLLVAFCRAQRCVRSRGPHALHRTTCAKHVFHVVRNKVGVLPAKTHIHMTSVWRHTRSLQQPPDTTSFARQPSRRREEPRINVLHDRTHVLQASVVGTYHKGCLEGFSKCARPVVTDIVESQIKCGDRPVRLVMFPVTAVPSSAFLFHNSKRPTAQNNVMLHCVLWTGCASNLILRFCCHAHAIPCHPKRTWHFEMDWHAASANCSPCGATARMDIFTAKWSEKNTGSLGVAWPVLSRRKFLGILRDAMACNITSPVSDVSQCVCAHLLPHAHPQHWLQDGLKSVSPNICGEVFASSMHRSSLHERAGLLQRQCACGTGMTLTEVAGWATPLLYFVDAFRYRLTRTCKILFGSPSMISW